MNHCMAYAVSLLKVAINPARAMPVAVMASICSGDRTIPNAVKIDITPSQVDRSFDRSSINCINFFMFFPFSMRWKQVRIFVRDD